MTITTKSYVCWRRGCRENNLKKIGSGRIMEDKLIKRKEDIDHIDYCCPDCESVIICVHLIEEGAK